MTRYWGIKLFRERLALRLAPWLACSVDGGIASEPRSETAKGSFRHAAAPPSTERAVGLLPEVPSSWSVPLEPPADLCDFCWDYWGDDICPRCGVAA